MAESPIAGPRGECGLIPAEKYDLAIVGFGLAGAAAALEAARLGARVMVLDAAAPERAGGNSLVSGQGVTSTVDQSQFARYLRGIGVPPTFAAALADEAPKALELLRHAGVEFQLLQGLGADFPEVDGASSVQRWKASGDGIRSMTRIVQEQAVRSGASLRCEARAIGLEHLEGGGMLVTYQFESRLRVLEARHGLVLACGGWGAVHDLWRGSLGTPHARGDGLRLGMQLGAFSRRTSAVSGPYYGFRIPGSRTALTPWPLYSAMPGSESLRSSLVAQSNGRMLSHPDSRFHGLTVNPRGEFRRPVLPDAYLVIAESDLESGPLVRTWPDGHARAWGRWTAPWSESNERELALGWIRAVGSGFRRHLGASPRANLFSLRVTAVILNTLGGMRVDEGYRVHGRSRMVPGLFAAGELASAFRMRYQGSANLMECVISGTRAARSALKGNNGTASRRG